MIISAKRSTLFILIFLFSLSAFAQGFAVGYNIGRFTLPMRNMEVMTYEFNKAHPNFSDPYHFANFYRGLTFAFFRTTSSGGIEMMWSNKHIITDTQGADNPGDPIYKHQVKARVNKLSFGGYVPVIPKALNVGIDYDILGFCRFYKKIAPEAEFKQAKWEKLFDRKGFLDFGFTFFAEVLVGPIKIRPYYQWSILPGSVSYGLRSYAFKTSNYGVAAYLAIQKKSD